MVQVGNLTLTALLMAVPILIGLKLYGYSGRWKWAGGALMLLGIMLLAALLFSIPTSYEFTQTQEQARTRVENAHSRSIPIIGAPGIGASARLGQYRSRSLSGLTTSM